MKRKWIMMIAFCVVVFTAKAQISVGVKGGLNVSSIEEYNGFSLDSRAGFHGGIMLQYMMNDNIGIESGLYYSLMGGREKEKDYDNPNRIDDYVAKANPSYLQLPLYAIYKFDLGQDMKFYPSLGVYFGYGLSGNYDLKGQDDGVVIDKKEDFFNDERNRFDMGVGVGVNFQYNRIVFGVGYEQGFLKINKHDFPYEDENAYNSNLKVSVGYLF